MSDQLPPLPEPTAFLFCKDSEVTARAWNCDQMRAYAAAAVAAERERCAGACEHFAAQLQNHVEDEMLRDMAALIRARA